MIDEGVNPFDGVETYSEQIEDSAYSLLEMTWNFWKLSMLLNRNKRTLPCRHKLYWLSSK